MTPRAGQQMGFAPGGVSALSQGGSVGGARSAYEHATSRRGHGQHGQWLATEHARLRLFRGGGLPSAHGAFEERTGVLLLSARALCFYTDTGPTGGAAAGGIGTHSAAAVAIAACAGTGGGGDAALLPGPLEVKSSSRQLVLPLGLLSHVRLEKQLFGTPAVAGCCALGSRRERLCFKISFGKRNSNAARRTYEAIVDAIGRNREVPHEARNEAHGDISVVSGTPDVATPAGAAHAPAGLPLALFSPDNPFVVHVRKR